MHQYNYFSERPILRFVRFSLVHSIILEIVFSELFASNIRSWILLFICKMPIGLLSVFLLLWEQMYQHNPQYWMFYGYFSGIFWILSLFHFHYGNFWAKPLSSKLWSDLLQWWVAWEYYFVKDLLSIYTNICLNLQMSQLFFIGNFYSLSHKFLYQV